MRIQELSSQIRKARLEQGLTQAQLANSAGLSRVTLNLLESGLIRELGFRKVVAVLARLGLELTLEQSKRPRRPDYVRMGCITANVSFKSALTEDELIHALVTGKVPPKRSAHIRTLLDEGPPTLLNGLVGEAARWTRAARLEKNLMRLAHDAGASRGIGEWLKIG